jgi:preprotein translocase subunit SecG
MNVLRRITALLAMVALIGLLVLLVWHVEMHHEHGSVTDEPAVVMLSSRSA